MLENAVKAIREDKELRAVVLQSASPKSFVVGANINVLKTLDADNIQVIIASEEAKFAQPEAATSAVVMNSPSTLDRLKTFFEFRNKK